MGTVGTGSVVSFSTPQYTIYLYCSVMGMNRYYHRSLYIQTRANMSMYTERRPQKILEPE